MLSSAVLRASDFAATKNNSGSGVGTLVLVALIGLAFFFLILRPQRNRQRRAQQMKEELQPGVDVLTTAGLFAKVVSIDEDGSVRLEVAPGVVSRYSKAAIARVIVTDPYETTEDEAAPAAPSGQATESVEPVAPTTDTAVRDVPSDGNQPS